MKANRGMDEAMQSSRDIYKDVRSQTDQVLKVLEQPVKDLDLSDAIETAKDAFSKLKDEADSTLQELDRNAEWDAFTVALYGETNAGKSTIIETLRILMREKSKIEQQAKFLEVRDRNGIDANTVQRREQKSQELAACDGEMADLELRFDDAKKHQQQLENEKKSQAETIATEIDALPFWRRGLSFLWKIPAKKKLDSCRNDLNSIVADKQRLARKHEQELQAIQFKKQEAQDEVNQIDAAMKELVLLEDGSIIGDGRSDFTRDTIRYDFDMNGSKLVLLDVPGIEGKEDLVLEPIMQAVQKAHAVLYVTRKADPPQKGDESKGSKGTLEKIKEHLGAQTEVWSIFNKGIKSVEPLRAKQLVNEGERDGLAVLEAEMRKQLGENYAGLLPVSAYAAFLASTENLIPGGEKFKARMKFLAAIDADSILKKTGFQDLAAKLSSEMAENSRIKIRKSNFNKANAAVLQLQSCVAELINLTFNPLVRKLKGEARDAVRQLNSGMNALKARLESGAIELIDAARNRARKKIYEVIDSDVNNDEFERKLRHYIDLGGSSLESDLPRNVEANARIFQEELESIAEQFREHVTGFLDDASRTGSMKFELKIKIDNGISLVGLGGAAIGAVLLWWNPVGWVLGLISAIGIIFSAYKAVRSFFSSDYKNSQQKKAADENLKKVFDSLRRDYSEQLLENFELLEEKLEGIKKGFGLPAIQAEQIVKSLADAEKRLAKISRQIIQEGTL
jgi:tRNA U34 5-carboxymethylaminomethyl modifying GTPase MnmE/TrmE